MEQIARCESTNRQFNDDGTPLESSTSDYGYFQINAPTWDKEAQELGLDYKHSFVNNLAMARLVYDLQGPTAWTCYRLAKPSP